MPQVKPAPASESVLGLDGEDTLSERGSVVSRQGQDGASSSSVSARTKIKRRNSLNSDRVELDGPEVARSSSTESTWSLDGSDDRRRPLVSRRRNVNSERSVSSCALIGRPRGVLRLRKLPQNVSIEGGTGGCKVLQSNGIAKAAHFLGRKRKRELRALKENRAGGDDPVSCLKTVNGTCDPDSRSKFCSENDSPVEKQPCLSGEPSEPVHVDNESSGHVREDAGVSLEEDAARMLCSLSDNRCADPPRKRMESLDRSSKESSLQYSNHLKDPYNKVEDLAGPARLLRKRDGKVPSRKRRPRRHFYEVSPRDVDPFCIVKERIRVFWPLDETWYFGLVKEYDPVTRLHHVKYDDKDEEWINLQNERIKLLLLPGEGRKRSNRNNSMSVIKPKYEGDKREEIDGNSTGSSESEPVISFLARSNQVRSATSSNINNHDQCDSNIVHVPFGQNQCLLSNSLDFKQDKLCSNDAMPGSSTENEALEVLKDRTTSGARRFGVVYARKRLCRRKAGFLNIPEKDSNPERRASSAVVLASVIGRESCTEIRAPVKHVMLALSLPLKSVYKFVSEACSVWVSNTLFHPQHGTLVALWPAVCLEILLVDNALGLKHLLLETCLRSAVSLFCLLAGSFHQYSGQISSEESKRPCTSIRFQISGLHGRSQVVFALFSFSGIDKSQWRNLQGKLPCQYLQTKFSKVNCTYANITQLTNRTNVRVSTLTNLVSKSLSFDIQDSQFVSDPDVDPVICCFHKQSGFTENHLDVAAAPSLLLCRHLKLIMESNLTSDLGFRAAPASGSLDVGTVGCISHSSSVSKEHSTAGVTASQEYDDNNIGDANLICRGFSDQNGPDVGNNLCSSNLNVTCSPQKSEEGYPSINRYQDKSCDPSDDTLLNKEEKGAQLVSNLVQKLNEHPIGCVTPTAPRTTYHRNRFTSISRTFGDGSKLCPEDATSTGFVGGGSKRPRSQVSYSVSPRSDELGLKHKGHFRKMQPHSSGKTNYAKRPPENTRSGQNSPEALTCVANVLVTVGDRGWREYDTQITIDTDGQSDRRICVKLAEGRKYAHKVCQVLQPGATNRYTHAMIWKGGPEWYLEFPDRSQWLIFKQMHDECYSHNIRAASVKNIPIPGVRLVEGHDDNDAVPFVRSQDYLGHMGTDVEMALEESRVVYDMDTNDEEWISSWRTPLGGKNSATCELTEDLFERVMDKFEKFAHSHNCNELSIDQMKVVIDTVPLDIVKVIHDYWHEKRQKKGMPLVRHFQSAMWKIYEQQLQEWESTVHKMQGSSNGYQEKSLPPKPALFAFCLKPRGLQLQIPHKGPKQRSHKKLMYSGCHGLSREQDGFYRPVSDRKYNEYVGDGRTYESYDGGSLHSPTGYFSPRFSMRTDSPRGFEASEKGSTPRFFRTNSVKRNASFAFSEDHQPSPSFRHQKIKRGASDHWNTVTHEYQNSKHLFPGGPSQSQIEELKVQDATSAAQHAATMAKLKRERAHCLMHKADLALHKASVALMIADAIRASSRDSSQDGRRDLWDEER